MSNRYFGTLKAELHGRNFAYNCCMQLVYGMPKTRISIKPQHYDDIHTQHEKCHTILKHV